jgi:hypothetical protein
VITTTDIDATIAIGDSISVTVTARDDQGNPVATSASGSVVVVRGSTVNATGTGFKPGSPVEVWLNSDPILLGSGFADSNGELGQTFDLGSDVPLGDHTLVLHGVSVDDEVVTMALGVSVLEAEVAQPIETADNGGIGTGTAAALALLLLAGGALVARRVTRKR